MKKYVSLFLVLFSLAALGEKADANPFLMNHERFVHLNEKDKNLVLVRTMELMVELESKYELETKTSGYSEERYQKYVQMINKLQNFILSEAVADDAVPDKKIPRNESFEALAQNFSLLLEKLKPNGCIYGGYVSIMNKSNGHSSCRHPSSVTAKNTPNYKLIQSAYLSKSGTTDCVGPSNISCNPVVFGYKQSKTKVPFCVATSSTATNSKNHNVSYECMRRALDENPAKDTDSKADRLKYLRGAMEYNKEAFDKVHHTIFKTCACGDASEDGLDAAYVAYMKPHRTCFGMMNSLRNIKSTECEAAGTEATETEFATEWSEYFGNVKGFKYVEPAFSADFDRNYAKLISNKAVVDKLCNTKVVKEEPPVVPVVTVQPPQKEVSNECKSSCEDKEGKIFCTVTEIIQTTKVGENEGSEQITKFKVATVEVTDPKATSVKFTPETGDPIECPIVRPAPVEKQTTCSVTLEDSADKKQIIASLVSDGKAEELEKVEWTGATVDDKDKTKASLPFSEEAISVGAKVTYKGKPAIDCSGSRDVAKIDPAPVEEVLSCAVSVIDDADKKNILFEVSSAKADIESVTWSGATVDPADSKKASKAFTSEAVNVDADVKFKDGKSVKCSGTRGAASESPVVTPQQNNYMPNQQQNRPPMFNLDPRNTRRQGVR